MTPLRRREIKKVSDKKRAELAAEGKPVVFSTISRKLFENQRARSSLKKVGAGKPKREASNAKYYKSSEWRAKRKAVFARDGYRCTETWSEYELTGKGSPKKTIRCPNYDETEKGVGLIAEEGGYQHRGIPDAIDRIRTRCTWCDRKRTPQERANWMHR